MSLPAHDVCAAVDDVADEMIALRRDIHTYPELAWQEERTTAVVAKRPEDTGSGGQLLPKPGLSAELGS